MKPRLLLPVILSSTLILLWISACNNNGEGGLSDKKDTLKIRSLDPGMVTQMNDSISPDVLDEDTTSQKLFGGKGKLWKVWTTLHKECMNNELSKGMIFFGVSNSLGLGTVLKYDDSKKKYIPEFPLLADKFTEDQKKLVFNQGTLSSCTYQKTTRISADFMAKSNFSTASSGELSGLISSAKSIEAKIESYQQNNLFSGGLGTVLLSSNNTYFRQYDSISKQPDRYIINQEIKVTSFSATIKTSTSISPTLKASLQNGIIGNIGDTEAKVTFSYVSDKEIKVTTQGGFVVFVDLVKREQ